jgi:Phage tail tube protein
MSKCASTAMRVTTVVFDGINLTPLAKTAMIKLGGIVSDGGEMDTAGRYFGGSKFEPSEVEFEIPNTADFNPEQFRGQCGDLMFLTDGGASYLVTNAQCASNIELKDGENKIKLSFKGDAAVIY